MAGKIQGGQTRGSPVFTGAVKAKGILSHQASKELRAARWNTRLPWETAQGHSQGVYHRIPKTFAAAVTWQEWRATCNKAPDLHRDTTHGVGTATREQWTLRWAEWTHRPNPGLESHSENILWYSCSRSFWFTRQNGTGGWWLCPACARPPTDVFPKPHSPPGTIPFYSSNHWGSDRVRHLSSRQLRHREEIEGRWHNFVAPFRFL